MTTERNMDDQARAEAEWMEGWNALTPEERERERFWMSVYAAEGTREIQGKPLLTNDEIKARAASASVEIAP